MWKLIAHILPLLSILPYSILSYPIYPLSLHSFSSTYSHALYLSFPSHLLLLLSTPPLPPSLQPLLSPHLPLVSTVWISPRSLPAPAQHCSVTQTLAADSWRSSAHLVRVWGDLCEGRCVLWWMDMCAGGWVGGWWNWVGVGVWIVRVCGESVRCVLPLYSVHECIYGVFVSACDCCVSVWHALCVCVSPMSLSSSSCSNRNTQSVEQISCK